MNVIAGYSFVFTLGTDHYNYILFEWNILQNTLVHILITRSLWHPVKLAHMGIHPLLVKFPNFNEARWLCGGIEGNHDPFSSSWGSNGTQECTCGLADPPYHTITPTEVDIPKDCSMWHEFLADWFHIAHSRSTFAAEWEACIIL